MSGVANDRELKKSRAKPHRTFFLKVDDLKLDTYEGQNEMLRRIEVAFATTDLNQIDMKALRELKETVKIKTDLDVLKMFQTLKDEIEKAKKKE